MQLVQTYGIVYGPRGKSEPHQVSSSSHLQKAQSREEQSTEAMMLMKGNSNVLKSLRDFHRNLRENDQFQLKESCRLEIDSFVTQLDSFIYDANMQIERGQLLAGKIAARKAIVGFPRHLENTAGSPANMSRFCSIFKAKQQRRWRS